MSVRRRRWPAIVPVLLALAGAACRGREAATARPTKLAAPPAKAAATFVGRAACAPCHAAEEARWKGSHHDLAMQEATEATVLGDFRDAKFTHYGVTSTFYRKAGGFFVRTDGPDGRLTEYPIAYTFGVYPLQQYLIAFPGGRYQALNVVWDARPKTEGGQRWFHLYPKEAVPHGDALHWTGPYQNWNFMCADCHSTNVKKGFDAATNAYATTFSEIDVSCEACHGPGSAHVAWAQARSKAGASVPAPSGPDPGDMGLAVRLKDPTKAVWEMDPSTGIAKRSAPRTSQAEIETCARCHARRSVVAADYTFGEPVMQAYRPALLEESLYFDDGQIRDEVYEYGSFLQSRMHAKGVSCTDCHDPHDLKVKGGADRVCAACHLPEKFETPQHTFHRAGSAGARCVSCHMPTRDYMVIHARRDHSLRVPRPDLSLVTGAPNACTQCHRDKSDRWAADAARKWWGPKAAPERDSPHFGEILHAARESRPGASGALAAYVGDASRPGIRRGTAAALLPPGFALTAALADPDPLVRLGAVQAAAVLEPEARGAALSPLLADPIRTVRIEAARALAPGTGLPPAARTAYEAGLAEWVASQQVNADRAEAHSNLGSLYAAQGDLTRAEAEYRRAFAITPALGGVWANLADVYRQQGRDSEGEKVLREGLAAAPDDPGLHYALGLALVRLKRTDEALEELRRASEMPPDRARYDYVYAVALDSAGRTDAALRILAAAAQRHPGDREVLAALASFSAKRGDRKAAAAWGEKLLALDPADPQVRAFVERLRTP